MTTKSTKAPFWYWIISVIAFIWNAFGVNQYLGQAYQTETWKASLTPEDIEIANAAPAWVTAVFAIAVFSGLLGSLGLLLKKSWSKPVFFVSLIAVILQMGYTLAQGYTNHIGVTITIIIMAVFLVWFSKYASKKGWFNN